MPKEDLDSDMDEIRDVGEDSGAVSQPVPWILVGVLAVTCLIFASLALLCWWRRYR